MRLATGSCSPAATAFGWAFFAGLLLAALGLCFNGVIAQDEGELLVYPSLFARGARPYKDKFLMHRGSSDSPLASPGSKMQTDVAYKERRRWSP